MVSMHFKNLEVEGIGPGNVKKIMAAGFDTVAQGFLLDRGLAFHVPQHQFLRAMPVTVRLSNFCKILAEDRSYVLYYAS